MSFKARVLLLSLMALLLMGSVSMGTAYAGAGPFFHVREAGAKGGGEGISETNPLEVQGEGGEQSLRGKIGSTEVEIVAKSVQVKGVIYNNALQGQIKVTLIYHEPKLVKPAGLTGCQVKIGFNKNNEVEAQGHLAWKYRGGESELKESPVSVQKPDIIFTPGPIKGGETKLPEGTFTEVTLSPSKECGVLTGTFAVKGNIPAVAKSGNLEEWGSELTTTYPGWKQQHFWNGKESIAAEPVSTFGGNQATLTGSIGMKAPGAEVAIFEAAPVIIEENEVVTKNFGMLLLLEEKTQEFKYENIGNAAWMPRVPIEVIVRIGQWSMPFITDVNCLNGNIAANGGKCTVKMKAKPEVAGGGVLIPSYRPDRAAPAISIMATS